MILTDLNKIIEELKRYKERMDNDPQIQRKIDELEEYYKKKWRSFKPEDPDTLIRI